MQKITEEMRIHDEWYKESINITLETLPEFLRKLSEDYRHDYGTICYAISAAALAAARAMDKSPQGGITGFQASCIMWGFIKEWTGLKNEPLKFIQFKDMLYPQNAIDFISISQDVWKWLQKTATEELRKILIFKRFGKKEIIFRRFNMSRKNCACLRETTLSVFSHWKNIVNGNIPFGFIINR